MKTIIKTTRARIARATTREAVEAIKATIVAHTPASEKQLGIVEAFALAQRADEKIASIEEKTQ